MAYGFNDDKSKFDLSDIGSSRVGTFTPNANRVRSSNVQVWADGAIGHIAGLITLLSTTTTTGIVGHIDGITPDAGDSYSAGMGQCGFTTANGQARMSVQANGDVFYTRDVTGSTVAIGPTIYFNFDFVATED